MLELKDKLIAHNELKEGKSVQLALLPDENPEIPGWDVWLSTRPAHEVGGDLVDFMPLIENKYYLALGDVAGKGLGAALLMAKLQSTLRAITQDCENLEYLGSKINAIFHRDSLPEKFASLVYLESKENSGTIRMLNAGHLPPLILNGSTIIETDKGAPAIGIMKETQYSEQEINLEKDDILFVYSDGLVEACNDNDEFYGETNLQKILQKSKDLPCNEIAERIITSVNKFIGDTPLYDDLSMIILKRK
jgi:sigma-B regulation protein RsbU (phosphoserine phosphatase)